MSGARRIDAMGTCCICENLQVITTDRVFRDPMCYPCERVLYRIRSGLDVRIEDLARAGKARAWLERKAGKEVRQS